MLFGQVWNRTDKLSLRDRSLVTVTALMAQGLVDSSFRYHLTTARQNGITKEEIAEILTHAAFYAGWPKAWAAFNMAKEVWAGDAAPSAGRHAGACGFDDVPHRRAQRRLRAVFHRAELPCATRYLRVGIYNVTFEPGCRNNWHIHHADEGGGQILVCVAGRGWYQEWDKPAQLLTPGSVINIPAGVKHWHGAAQDSWMSHLAVKVPGVNGRNEWLEPVSDAQYEVLV